MNASNRDITEDIEPGVGLCTFVDDSGFRVVDVMFEARRARLFDAARPTALIIGNAINTDRLEGADSEAFARVGELLAAQHFNIVTNACPGVPQQIVERYLDAPQRELVVDLSALKYPGEKTSTRGLSPCGFPSVGDITFYCDANFEVLSAVNPRFVDCVVVIGGGLGSLLECITAVMNDLPVVCFAPFGGVADLIPQLFRDHQSGHLELVVHKCVTVKDLSLALQDVELRHVRRGQQTNLASLVRHARVPQEEHSPLQLRIAPGLTHVDYVVGDDTLRISDPRLLDDPATLDHRGHAGAVLKSRLATRSRRYEFGSLHIDVRARHVNALWGPSIDTFLLMEAIAEAETGRSPARSALDVGCGSGILALWLRSTGLAQTAIGVDKNVLSIKCSIENTSRNKLDCQFSEADFRTFSPERPFDLIVSNPPYANTDVGPDDLALLDDLLSRYQSMLSNDGRCYALVSSVSLPGTDIATRLAALENAGVATRLSSRELPLKVDQITGDRRHLASLIDRGAVVVREDADYPFTHRVEAWRLGK